MGWQGSSALASRVLLDHGQRERAEALQREIETLAGRTRDPELILSPIGMEGILAVVDGRLEEAVALGARYLARDEELGSPVLGRQQASILTTRPLLYLGRAEEALAAAPQAARMAGLEQDPAAVVARRALLLAYLGRRMEAQVGLRQLPVLLSAGPDGDEASAGVLLYVLEAVVLLGDREAAALLSQRLAPTAALCLGTSANTCVARHLGAAMALLGEYDKARAYYQQALEVCARVRLRPEIALTRLQLAELLLDQVEGKFPLPQGEGKGEGPASVGPQHAAPLQQDVASLRKEALGHLDFAIAEFRAMKMQPSLERALGRKRLLRA